jgi:hypothetical protein
MNVLICSNLECATFDWGDFGSEVDITQPCAFCGASLKNVTQEEQAEADIIVESLNKGLDIPKII